MQEDGVKKDVGGEGKDYSGYTKEELVKELRVLREQKRYGLVWEEKMEEVVERCKREAPILEPVKKMGVKSGKDERRHIMIEGDNYHSLQVLNYTHKGKIDVIYIDPPYNTGNKDFIFNDSFVDKEDTYRHSKWLSFMEKRLRLARDLLSRKGVIFISIDDNEQANLRLLCDSVFGEENFVANVIWNSRKSVSSDAIVSMNHNHTFLYAKKGDILRLCVNQEKRFKLPVSDEKFSNPDDDPRGPWAADPFEAAGVRSNLSYEIQNPKTGKVYLPVKGRHWAVSEERYVKLLDDNRIVFGKSGQGKPMRKRFLSEAIEKGATPKSIWDDVGTTTNGTKELEEIFGEKNFNNPKPVSLIKKVLQLSSCEDSIVLDFFAGSGTTGHAVMELNREDGGSRQFILCTNNENNNGNGDGGIAESVCQPRIKKVMEGYKKNGDGEKVAGLGGSLEYLRTAFVDVDDIGNVSDAKRLKFTHQAGHVIALKENAFIEEHRDEWYQIFTDGAGKYVGLYFREDVEKLEELEQKILDKDEVKLYIFSHGGGGDDWLSDYEEYDNVTVEDIPEPILRVYRGLNS